MVLELNQLEEGEVYAIEGDFPYIWYITYIKSDRCGISICVQNLGDYYINKAPCFGRNFSNFLHKDKMSFHTLTLKEYFWFNYSIKNKLIHPDNFTMDLIKTDDYIDSMILDSIEKTKIFEYVLE
jgi:hypothetical protein